MGHVIYVSLSNTVPLSFFFFPSFSLFLSTAFSQFKFVQGEMFLLIGFSAIGFPGAPSLSTPFWYEACVAASHSVFVIVDGVEPANRSLLFTSWIKRLKEKDVVSKSESFKTKNGSRYRRMKRVKNRHAKWRQELSLSLSLGAYLQRFFVCLRHTRTRHSRQTKPPARWE